MTCYMIVIEHDADADMSWLEQDHYDPRSKDYDPVYPSEADMKAGTNAYDGDWYRDPQNHVALQMLAYDEDGNIVDSLGSIDFLADSTDWRTGTFYDVSNIRDAPYLQEFT